MARLPHIDLTGQKFHHLTVVGEGTPKIVKGYEYPTWLVRCDCGKELNLRRSSFARKNKPQKSCGCISRSRFFSERRKPENLTGRRFGTLTAIKLIEKSTWQFKCDCGKLRSITATHLATLVDRGLNITCGDTRIHRRGEKYPPTPKEYDSYAYEILQKHLHLCDRGQKNQIDSELRDFKMDLLARASWIIAYRRRQGETITELHEINYIRKCLRNAKYKLQRTKKTSLKTPTWYNEYDVKIGCTMTIQGLNDEAVAKAETQPDSIVCNPSRLRFKRR